MFSPGFHYLFQFATVPFHADWLSNMNFAIVCNSNSTTWLFPDQILKGWHIVWTCLFWSNFEMLQHDRQPEPAVCWLLVEPGGTITKLLLLALLLKHIPTLAGHHHDMRICWQILGNLHANSPLIMTWEGKKTLELASNCTERTPCIWEDEDVGF